jgi:NAD(P)-dependent dehydrogenase (short-subunit alcohol dehydrogenase family)
MTQSSHLREMVCDPHGRTVLVTAADNAVGSALVGELLSAGAATIWAGYGSSVSQGTVLQGLAAGSKQIKLVNLDLTAEQSVRDAAAALGSEVDILINTAESRESAQAEMDIHYFGLLRLAHAFGPMMRARAAAVSDSERGPCAWVNLLSIGALSSAPGQSTFSASKAAAYSLSQALRADMLAVGIRVLNVFPGPVDDEWARKLPPPKLAPASLARAMVEALLEGVEDVYPGDVAQDWFNRWRSSPKALERELAARRPDRSEG